MAATIDSTKANQANPSVRASTRFSTYSATPTLTPSVAPSQLSQAPKKTLTRSSSVSTAHTSNSTDTSIKHYSTHLARLDDSRLSSQRYVADENKSEELKALALGAKLERALGRRMSGQDAVFTKKPTTVKC